MLTKAFWDYFKEQAHISGKSYFQTWRRTGETDPATRRPADYNQFYQKWVNALHGSGPTCGVAELGGLASCTVESEIKERVLRSLLTAFKQNRGLILYFHPTSAYRESPAQRVLRDWGFEVTREFTNPNTGNRLEELSVVLPSRAAIEEGRYPDAN